MDSDCEQCQKRNYGVKTHQSNDGKNAKERNHRSDLQSLIQNKQDILLVYGILTGDNGIGGKRQSAGNAASSGLEYNKLEIEIAFMAVTLKLLDTGYKAALTAGRESDYSIELVRHVEWCQEAGSPLIGTLMYSSEHRCERDTSSAKCIHHHHHGDWSECRKERAEATFRDNKYEFRANYCDPFIRARKH